MKEDYVSYEVAKLLKEKGFDELCSSLYNIKTEEATPPREYVFNGDWSGYILRPTLQMAMKWLRENHDIFIVIRRGLTGTGWVYSHEIYKDSQCLYAQYGASYNTYEEAVEKALKFSLENLIK